MTNAADPRRVKARARDETRRRDEAISDLRRLMAEPWSRRWLWSLLGQAGVFESSFHPSGSITYFNEGRRVIGLDLLKDITTLCPTDYLTMIDEANARHTQQERDHDDPSSSPGGGLDPLPGADSDPE